MQKNLKTVLLVYFLISGCSPRSTQVPQATATPTFSVLTPAAPRIETTYLADLEPDIKILGAGEWTIGITTRGTNYPKAIFAHARSILVYRLNGQYDRFVTSAFIDAGAECPNIEKDGAVFSISVDEEEVFRSDPITYLDSPTNVDINVAGADFLVLNVYPSINKSEANTNCDWSWWGDPGLVKDNAIGKPVSNISQTYLAELVPSVSYYVFSNLEIGSVGGFPLESHARSFPMGILAHAPSTLEYDLEGKYDRFISDVAFADSLNINSNCGDGTYFVVILDGEVLFRSSTMTFASAVEHVDVDVSGGKVLRLDTYGSLDFNADNICDWTFWGDPVLISNRPAENLGVVTPTPPTISSQVLAGILNTGLYVSPDGNDANPGTIDRPFATLQHARDVVRLVNQDMKVPVNIYLREGTYPLSETLEFTSQDSGTNGYNVIYQAYQDEKPVLSGGVEIVGFQPVPGEPYWKVTLPQNTNLFRNLYVNGVRATRAHTEKTIAGIGWLKGDWSAKDGILLDLTGPGWWASHWQDFPVSRMIMNPADLPSFSRPQDLEVHWIMDWVDIRARVAGVSDLGNNKIALMMMQPYLNWALGIDPGMEGKWTPRWDVPFFIENALELMDNPGEWYYNRDSRDLYYYPQPGEIPAGTRAVIPQLDTLVSIKGGGIGDEAHNIEFRGITFSYNSWMRASEYGTASNYAQWLQDGVGGYNYSTFQTYTPAAIQMEHAHDILFTNNIVEHIGSVGLGLNNDVQDVQVTGNMFQDISDSSITLSQGFRHAYINAPNEAAVGNIQVKDNLIYKTSLEYWGAPGITAYFVDHIVISHNLVKEINYSGIAVGFGHSVVPDSTTSHDNIILDNRIERVSLSGINGNPEFGGDAGGIYTLGQQPGTRIEGNYIKDVVHNYACIYFDEGSAFLDILHNVCENAPSLFNQSLTSQHDDHLADNFSNVNISLSGGQNIIKENNTQISSASWPPAAQSIVDSAGLEPDYLHLMDYILNK